MQSLASYPKHCQAPKELWQLLCAGGQGMVFLAPPQHDYAVLPQSHMDPNWEVSWPGESEDREQRGKGMGISHCMQLPGKLGNYTGLCFNPSFKRGCKILDTLMKTTDVTQDCVPQVHPEHQLFSPEHARHAMAWGTTGRRWPILGAHDWEYRFLPQPQG